MRRITAVLLSLLCAVAVFFLPVTASATGAGTAEQFYKLNIKFCPGGIPVEGAEFYVYHVAEPTSDGGFRLAGAFAGYRVSLDDLDSDSLRSLAATLAGYAARDNIRPDDEDVTNRDGIATLTVVKPGMYLVAGPSVKVDGTVYWPSPVMIFLPSADGNGEISIETKPDRDTGNEIHVVKVWRDGKGEKRPPKIVVQLLCDSVVYDEVTLNEANNWRYTWTDLEDGHIWQILEKEVPEGYSVKVERQSVTFTVTNTAEVPDEPKLPQTGQNWWPVLLLICVGMVLLTVGLLMRTSDATGERSDG